MVVAHVIIVSAQSKELGFWVFLTWSDLRVRIWGLLGQGIGDLDSGLTIVGHTMDVSEISFNDSLLGSTSCLRMRSRNVLTIR